MEKGGNRSTAERGEEKMVRLQNYAEHKNDINSNNPSRYLRKENIHEKNTKSLGRCGDLRDLDMIYSCLFNSTQSCYETYPEFEFSHVLNYLAICANI